MRDALGELESLSDRPEYRNRDAKLDLLTKQNLDGCLRFLPWVLEWSQL